MSTIGTALTTWEEFLELPDSDENGDLRYELHDGEVVLVPPPKPIHVLTQWRMQQLLGAAANGFGTAMTEFPYRPAPNLQFWRADVAYIPNEHLSLMDTDEYHIYAPPLIIEVLSPSNRPGKINRQRIAAFSGGTREFWVVDPVRRTVEVSLPGKPSRVYSEHEEIPVAILPGISISARKIFGE